jgi:hypothetical protein
VVGGRLHFAALSDFIQERKFEQGTFRGTLKIRIDEYKRRTSFWHTQKKTN